MAVDLSDLISQANTFAAGAKYNANQVFNLNLEDAVSHSDDAATQTDIGTTQAVIDGAAQSAAFQTQNAKISAANALGTNMKDQGELMTHLSSNILDLMAQKDKVLQDIKAKQSVGFFDDPLQHIINQFTINDDIDKHNAINEDLVAKETNVKALNELTQTEAITQNALAEPITQAGMVASAQNTADKAMLNVRTSQRAATASNVQGITSALLMNREALTTAFSVNSTQNAAEQMGIAQAHLALSQQEFDFRKQEKALADAARDKGTSLDNYMLGEINDGLSRLGQKQIDMTSPKAGNILSLIKSNSPAAQLYIRALNISQASEGRSDGGTSYAGSPFDAANMFYNTPNIKLNSAQAPVQDLITGAGQDLQSAAKAPGSTLNLKDKDSTAAAFNGMAQARLLGMAKTINPGDKSNVFQISAMGDLINASPEMQKLPVVANVIAPAVAAGIDLSDPSKVIALVTQAISDGKVSYADAKDLNQIYQRGVAVNLAARNLGGFGFNIIPDSTSKPNDPSMFTYRVPIKAGQGIFGGGSEVVNLTNVNEVGRIINKTLANQANSFNYQTGVGATY